MPRVIDGLRTLGEHAKGSGVGIIIESHGDFTDSPTLLELLKGAAMPNVALSLGRAPHVRQREGRSRPHLQDARRLRAAYPPEGFQARRDRSPLRPHRQRHGAGP